MLPQQTKTVADFFKNPIHNSPYGYPGQHWELEEGQRDTRKNEKIEKRGEMIDNQIDSMVKLLP